MTVAEILAQAKLRGVGVELKPAGDGLRIWSDGDPPDDLVELLKSAKPEIIAVLRAERGRVDPNKFGALTKPLSSEHLALVDKTTASRPPDAPDSQWRTAMKGLEAFLADGWADQAEAAGWPPDLLYAVPKLWSQVALTGAGLLIGDSNVVSITSDEIRITSSLGSSQAFYRWPPADYRRIYETRRKLIHGNYAAGSDEPRLRAIDHTINVCRANTGADLEQAKKIVLGAIVNRPAR